MLVVIQVWYEHGKGTQSFIMPDKHYVFKQNPSQRFCHDVYNSWA